MYANVSSGTRLWKISGLLNFQWWEHVSCQWWGQNPELQDLGQRKSTSLRLTCSWQPNYERGLRPQQRKNVLPLLLHGDDRYRYLDMLQQFLIPRLDGDDQEGRIHFQQDGSHPHYLGEVREWLNTRFPGRWIGRAAPVAWPPRSPDLPPPGIFLMGVP
jgi:hypothetical protein